MSKVGEGYANRVVSADGRYVAFVSNATALAPGASPAFSEVYVRDRLTGRTYHVTSGADGSQADGDSLNPAMSPDGRYVAFYSDASNLVPGDDNGVDDVFVRDLILGTVERIGVSAASNRYWRSLALSADGRYVAFYSEAPDLVSHDTNGRGDIFVRDRRTGTIERVSVDSAGQSNDHSWFPAMNADGRFVAFCSMARLSANDTNGWVDVFVRDRITRQTERISTALAGIDTDQHSCNLGPSISADGRYVAFSSYASGLVPNDTNGNSDVFVRDRQTGLTERISVNSIGVQGNDYSDSASVSSDGSVVAFKSLATNLVAGDTNGLPDAYVYERRTRRITRVSVRSDGQQSQGATSNGVAISSSGRHVVFDSNARDLAPNDFNGTTDVFVHELRQPIVYSNLSRPTVPQWFRNASVETVWDDARISGGGRLTGITVVANNSRPDPQPGCLVTVEFRLFDNPDGGPIGTTLGKVTLDMTGQLFGVGNTTLRVDGLGRFGVMLPDSARVAVGVQFHDATQSMGLVTFDPPTVGWSVPTYWVANDPTPVTCGSSLKPVPCNFGLQLRTGNADNAGFTIKPNELDFGAQALGTAATQSFWLRNNRSSALPIVNMSMRGPDQAAFTVQSKCGALVAAGAGCPIHVTFQPTTVGQKFATLKVIAGESIVRTRELTGTGVR